MRRMVFDPTLPLETQEFTDAPRPGALRGLRVGLLKTPSSIPKSCWVRGPERLEQQHGMRLVSVNHKQSSGHAISREAIALFQQQGDMVLGWRG